MNDRPELSKLPKYAQNYIQLLERERDEAIAKARRLTDNQTPSKIWVEDYGAELGQQKEYVQGRTVVVAHRGVCLRVDTYRDRGIELSWSAGDTPFGIGEVAFIPTAHQQARLTNVEDIYITPKVERVKK